MKRDEENSLFAYQQKSAQGASLKSNDKSKDKIPNERGKVSAKDMPAKSSTKLSEETSSSVSTPPEKSQIKLSAQPTKSSRAKKSARVFKQLSNVEHVRLRTGMWLGQNSLARYDQHFFVPTTKEKGGKAGKPSYALTFEEVEDVPAKLKCLDEVCMNAVDEYNRGIIDKTIKRSARMNTLRVTLHPGGQRVTVEDNGRGIPARNAEAVFLHLMYGENFDDTAREEHVAGQNGVGVSLVRIVSKHFYVETCHNKQIYRKQFTVDREFLAALQKCELSPAEEKEIIKVIEERGDLRLAERFKALSATFQRRLLNVFKRTGMGGHSTPLPPLKRPISPKDAAASAAGGSQAPTFVSLERSGHSSKISFPPLRQGTRVTFELAGEYFNDLDTRYNSRLLHQYLLDIAMTNPGLCVELRDETLKGEAHERETQFLFKRGLEDILAASGLEYYRLVHEERDAGLHWEAYILAGAGRTLSWINGNFASLGGTPIEYFENRFCDETRKKSVLLQAEKRFKMEIKRRDVREHFHVFHVIRLIAPRFKSQDKSYLINDLNAPIRHALEQHLDRAVKKLQLTAKIIESCERATRLKQLEAASKEVRRTARAYVEKLIPCSQKTPPAKRILFLGEGDSAVAGLRSVRSPATHALFPLRGKPLNVKGLPIGRVLQNEEFKNIVAILGLPLDGKLTSLKGLHYHRICIVTDADYDGYAIRSLLLSFFFEYWEALFFLNAIYLVEAPLYEVELASKDKKKWRSYCVNDEEFETLMRKAKAKGYTLLRKKRNKGLGETSPAALAYAIEHNLCPITVEDSKRSLARSRDVQKLWFARDEAARRRREISSYAQLFLAE